MKPQEKWWNQLLGRFVVSFSMSTQTPMFLVTSQIEFSTFWLVYYGSRDYYIACLDPQLQIYLQTVLFWFIWWCVSRFVVNSGNLSIYYIVCVSLHMMGSFWIFFGLIWLIIFKSGYPLGAFFKFEKKIRKPYFSSKFICSPQNLLNA